MQKQQPDESRDTDSLTLIITHDMAHVITLRDDTVFYSVRGGHPIGATVQTSHNRDYYENKWPSCKREFDTQRFIDKHRSLLDTISYKDSVRMIVSYDYVYMLYFNGKLVFWEYKEMLEELPKDAQILIRGIIELPGKLHDLPEAYDICRTMFSTSSLYANNIGQKEPSASQYGKETLITLMPENLRYEVISQRRSIGLSVCDTSDSFKFANSYLLGMFCQI